MMIYCSRPGDFSEPHHQGKVISLGKIGEGPTYLQIHCVLRRTPDGSPCLVAMNAYAMPTSFEILVGADAAANDQLTKGDESEGLNAALEAFVDSFPEVNGGDNKAFDV